MQQVTIGQVWEDNDRRRIDRKFRVERIVNGKAVCRVINAGTSKGKSPVRIRLDRFVPKYYKNISPRVVQDTNGVISWGNVNDALSNRCDDVLSGNWTSPFAGYAIMEDGPVQVIVREASRDSVYDIKVRINKHMILSFVDYNVLEHALRTVHSHLEEIRDCLDDVLDD
jgi:hypothetical protein